MPIPHAALRQSVVESVKAIGLTIEEEDHAIYGPGTRYFGILALSGHAAGAEYRVVLGLRNAHDRSFSASGVLGSHVFVCDNLAFSGEVSFRVRHTKNVHKHLADRSMATVGALLKKRDLLDAQITGLKALPLDHRQGDHYLCNLLRTGIISAPLMPRLLGDWDNQKYTPVLKDDLTLLPDVPIESTGWGLFNCITNALKVISPLELARRTLKLHAIAQAWLPPGTVPKDTQLTIADAIPETPDAEPTLP